MRVAWVLILAAMAMPGLAQPLRDPTRPPSFTMPTSGEESVQSDLVLQTVLVSAERRNATVNGRLVRVGDTVAGMRVIEIRESAVVLQGNGEQRTLLLFPAVEKRSQTVAGRARYREKE